MHRCFMTPNTIYVVVCDLDKVKKDGLREAREAKTAIFKRIADWLYDVKIYSPCSPILVALNKFDLDPERETWIRPREHLNQVRQINPSVHEIGRTSASTTANRKDAIGWLVEAIRGEISECLCAFENDVINHPLWLEIKWELEALHKNYISQATYKRICRNHHVRKREEQKELLDWLKRQGVSYYCEERRLFGGIIEKVTHISRSSVMVINPEWLFIRIYHVFNDEDNMPDGILTHAEMRDILKSQESSETFKIFEAIRIERELQFILEIMREFDISFYWNFDQEMIPSRITIGNDEYEGENIKQFQANFHLRWEAGENDCPVSLPLRVPVMSRIMHHIMSRNKRALKNNSKNCWRNGARFLSGEFEVIAIVEKFALDIYLNGPEQGQKCQRFLHDFCTIIRDCLRMHGITATEYIFLGNTPYNRELLLLNRETGQDNNGTYEAILSRFYLPDDLPRITESSISSDITSNESPSKATNTQPDEQPPGETRSRESAETDDYLASAREHNANADLSNVKRILLIVISVVSVSAILILVIFRILGWESRYESFLQLIQELVDTFGALFNNE